MIREMAVADVRDVVRVHLASFPNFFLSFLGPDFLGLFYEGVCKHPQGISFVVGNAQGTIVGFVVGVVDPGGFFSQLLKKSWFRFALASAGAVLRKPSIIPRLARAVLYPGSNPAGANVACLSSIGVLPDERGNDYGKILVTRFLGEARLRGCNEVYLTTDKEDNDYVNRFYKSMGFELERCFSTPEDRAMNEYRIRV